MEHAKKLIRFDWFIKKMLRDKSDYKVLEGFLTALLKKDIVVLSILESEGNQEREDSKFNRVDILVEDENKEKIIIEIQNEREADYLERLLFGSSKVIVDYFKLGSRYKEVSKVISVSILYFNLGAGKDYIYYGTTEFYGIHTKEKLDVRNKVVYIDEAGNEKIKYETKGNVFPEYYLINVEKFPDVIEEDIDEWIYMLKNSEVKTEFKSKYIKEAENKLNVAKLSEEELKRYEKHIEALVIEGDVMNTAKEEGRKEGIEEGIEIGEDKRALKVAENLLNMGMAEEVVAKAAEISVEKVKELKRKNGNNN